MSNKQRGQNQKWRDIATAKEAALMSSLRANTGYPVFLTGDFNERSEAYYKVTAGGRAVAASGGLIGQHGHRLDLRHARTWRSPATSATTARSGGSPTTR